MTMRSMPPASSHLADRPVPAPPPMIGSPRGDHGVEFLEDASCVRCGACRSIPQRARFGSRSRGSCSTSAAAKAGSLMWCGRRISRRLAPARNVASSAVEQRRVGRRIAERLARARRCAETPPSGIRKRTGPSHALSLLGDPVADALVLRRRGAHQRDLRIVRGRACGRGSAPAPCRGPRN